MELAAPLWIKGFIWLIKEIVWIADRERDPPFVLKPGGGYTGRPWEVGRMSELVWWWRDTELDKGGGGGRELAKGQLSNGSFSQPLFAKQGRGRGWHLFT